MKYKLKVVPFTIIQIFLSIFLLYFYANNNFEISFYILLIISLLITAIFIFTNDLYMEIKELFV